MRIACPHCGSRDIAEFVYRGDASVQRPAPTLPGDAEAMFAYVYTRANPMGRHDEHWYHAQGCRNWLVVTRDTRDHTIHAVRLARGDAA